jgi:hypothetical protein
MAISSCSGQDWRMEARGRESVSLCLEMQFYFTAPNEEEGACMDYDTSRLL